MNKRIISMLLIALALASLAAWAANRWIQGKVTVAEEDNVVPVIVAAIDIPFGVKLEENHIKIIAWPEDSFPQDAFKTKQEVVGKIVKNKFYPNEIITKKRVSEHLGGSTLSALITKNHRAVSVRVNDVVGVAGFILPGNSVDILATRLRRNSTGQRADTRTILENIRVLAVDQEASPDKEKPAIVRAVTLEITPQQAEKIVQAMQEGKIQLTLRNPLDSAVDMIAQQTVEEVVPVKKIRKPASITVIRGAHVSRVTGRL